ncbi:MAG: hypothetical protein RLY45_1639 [Actinomycetota bacterium]|jgi:hypothetical protein
MVVPRGWHVDDRRAAAVDPVPARTLSAPPPSVPGAGGGSGSRPGAVTGVSDEEKGFGLGFVRRRRRRTRHPEGPQPEQLVLLEFDAASAPVAAAVGASHEPVPDDDADGPSGTVTATAPAAAQDGAPTEAETASADTAAGDTAVVAVQEAGPDPSPAPDLGAAQSEPVDATPIAPWRPVFDHADDLGGVLQARSPLLSRAFGRRGRPPVTSADPDRSSTRSDRGDGHAGHDEG